MRQFTGAKLAPTGMNSGIALASSALIAAIASASCGSSARASADAGPSGCASVACRSADSGETTADAGRDSGKVRPPSADAGHDSNSPAAPCSFNGAMVSSGASVTAYQDSSVAPGNLCASENRTCTNGTLGGTYAYASCTVTTVPAFYVSPSGSDSNAGTLPAPFLTLGKASLRVFCAHLFFVFVGLALLYQDVGQDADGQIEQLHGFTAIALLAVTFAALILVAANEVQNRRKERAEKKMKELRVESAAETSLPVVR